MLSVAQNTKGAALKDRVHFQIGIHGNSWQPTWRKWSDNKCFHLNIEIKNRKYDTKMNKICFYFKTRISCSIWQKFFVKTQKVLEVIFIFIVFKFSPNIL
jgi:hypothetical protein